jgi:hypothetical protein
VFGPPLFPSFILRPRPIAAYRFDEMSRTRAADASGAGRDATVHSAGRSRIARGGTALQLDGRQAFAVVPALRVRPSTTMEAWVRPARGGHAGFQTVVAQAGAYALYASGPNGRASASAGRVTVAGPKLAAGRWTHLALTYDGIALRLLVNGDPISAREAPAPSGNGRITIGALNRTRHFAGRIDDVAIYGTALTGEQIHADMSRLP